MNDQVKTKKQLIAELQQLRRQLAEPRTRDQHGAAETPNIARGTVSGSEGSEPGRLKVVHVDSAELRQAKTIAAKNLKAVERERDLLQAVMNGARNCHLVYLDREFNFVCVNETYARTCGYTPEEMIGKNHFALYPHAENEAIFARVRDTGMPAEFHDKPFFFPDQPERGATYWDWTLVAVKDGTGEVTGLVFSLIETTARKQAESALGESEAKMRSIFRAAPIGIGVVSNRVLLEVNDRLCEIIGSSRDALIGKSSRMLYPTDEEYDYVGREKYRQIKKQGTGTVEARLKCTDGTIIDVLLSSSPLDPSDLSAGVMFTVLDITERNQTQEALRKLNETLEHRVEQRTVALKKSREQFRQLSDELLQAQENERKRVANEIHDSAGQVLAAIKYRVESACLKLQKTGASEALQPVKDLTPIVQTCIDDMRRLQMELRPTVLDDMGVVAAVEWFCREFEKTYPSITLERSLAVNEAELPESLKLVIFRIVQEALNNAGRHSDARLAHILLEQTEDEVVTLRIEDNGRGFDLKEALQVKAFGKGLGLSSMRERAQYSGGTLTIESALGIGTRIEAVWPKKALV